MRLLHSFTKVSYQLKHIYIYRYLLFPTVIWKRWKKKKHPNTIQFYTKNCLFKPKSIIICLKNDTYTEVVGNKTFFSIRSTQLSTGEMSTNQIFMLLLHFPSVLLPNEHNQPTCMWNSRIKYRRKNKTKIDNGLKVSKVIRISQ